MKFDYVIGNPPYQEESVGDTTHMSAVYHSFLDAAYTISDRVMMVHPGRFLFNAGATPKEWNQKMLNDEHLKVVFYEPDGSKVFPGTDIKGGVAVTYRDENSVFGAIGLFVPFEELRSVLNKVQSYGVFSSLIDVVYSAFSYRLTERVYNDHPEFLGRMSTSHDFDVTSNVFDILSDIFFDVLPDDDFEYMRLYGLSNGARVYKYVRKDYIVSIANTDFWKVFVPKANGSGALGEVLSTPVVGQPVVGHTQTFLSIGCFSSEDEATACLKYIKTKFSRAMLGILKITQDNTTDKWKYVPMQDFTSGSDIDWSQDVAGIDQQLYKKYGLDDDEIAFIEEKVRAM